MLCRFGGLKCWSHPNRADIWRPEFQAAEVTQLCLNSKLLSRKNLRSHPKSGIEGSHNVARGRTTSHEGAQGRTRAHEGARGHTRSHECARGRTRSHEGARGRTKAQEGAVAHGVPAGGGGRHSAQKRSNANKTERKNAKSTLFFGRVVDGQMA